MSDPSDRTEITTSVTVKVSNAAAFYAVLIVLSVCVTVLHIYIN